MFDKARSCIKRFTPLKILIPILLISVISIVSFAANAAISTSTYQGVQGVQFNVAGGLSASSNGFVVTQTSATATTQPAAWTAGGTVTTATTAGDWQYSITVTTNTGCPTSTTYTAIVQWNTGSGYSQLGSIQFTTPSTITNGAQMTFVFGTTVNSFSAPVGITITIG